MIILDVNKLGKNFGYGQLFEDVSFSLNEGESLSIVGPNGCGKSTLLKIIAGLEKADKGTVSIKKNTSIAYLDQTGSSIEDDRLAIDILKDAFVELNEMEKRLNNLQNLMNTTTDANEQNKVMEKYCNLVEQFAMAGGYEIETNIKTIAEGLKISKDILYSSYNDLSGGEKTLIQLAKSLLIKPELFLLDEPTNHLDINRIEWLEKYIKSFKGAVVIVSHDRYFLDKMSNKILSLENGQIKIYNTNYTGYLKEREKDFEKQMAEYKDQQQSIKRLEEQIKYFSERGMATNSSTLCDRAHALQTQLNRLRKQAIECPKKQKKLNVDFEEERKSGKKIISVENLTVRIPNGKTILDNISLSIFSKERVALLGVNGSGKSTFIKTIMGQQNLPFEGEIYVGPSVKIGYLPQIIQFANDDQSLLEYFKNQVGVNEQKARQILAGFQFYKDDLNKKVKNLSGGEKIRIKLAELLQNKINTLIFDEPTNHIDIPTKEVLEDAIQDFNGTLIFISHDRYFINKFADITIEFSNGKTQSFCGGYDYYKSEKEKLNKKINLN